MNKLNLVYVAVLASLAIFAIRLQLIGQMKAVDQALTNQSQAVSALREDINTIASFLNERTSVRVQTSQDRLELESDNAGKQ